MEFDSFNLKKLLIIGFYVKTESNESFGFSY